MSMPTNNEYRAPDTVEDSTVEPRRTTSPVLLTLLAFAVTAVRQWRFQPAQRDGQPVPGAVTVPIDFKMR